LKQEKESQTAEKEIMVEKLQKEQNKPVILDNTVVTTSIQVPFTTTDDPLDMQTFQEVYTYGSSKILLHMQETYLSKKAENKNYTTYFSYNPAKFTEHRRSLVPQMNKNLFPKIDEFKRKTSIFKSSKKLNNLNKILDNNNDNENLLSYKGKNVMANANTFRSYVKESIKKVEDDKSLQMSINNSHSRLSNKDNHTHNHFNKKADKADVKRPSKLNSFDKKHDSSKNNKQDWNVPLIK